MTIPPNQPFGATNPPTLSPKLVIWLSEDFLRSAKKKKKIHLRLLSMQLIANWPFWVFSPLNAQIFRHCCAKNHRYSQWILRCSIFDFSTRESEFHGKSGFKPYDWNLNWKRGRRLFICSFFSFPLSWIRFNRQTKNVRECVRDDQRLLNGTLSF